MEEAAILTYAIWFTVLVMFQVGILVFSIWLLRHRQVWSLIKFAIRGGTLVLKCHIDNTIEILHTKQAIDHVTWRGKDPLTKKTRILTQKISKVFHTLKGTSYPIHFCPYTYPTNINILTKEKADLNTDEINALMAKEYTQGYSDATAFKTVGGFPLDKATIVMLVILGVMVIANIALNLQIMGAVGA